MLFITNQEWTFQNVLQILGSYSHGELSIVDFQLKQDFGNELASPFPLVPAQSEWSCCGSGEAREPHALGLWQLQVMVFKKKKRACHVSLINGWWHVKVVEVPILFLCSLLNTGYRNNCCLHWTPPCQKINVLLALVIGRGGTSGNAKHIFNCYINMSFPC